MMNAKLGQHRFGHCHESGLVKTHRLVCFNFAALFPFFLGKSGLVDLALEKVEAYI